MKRLKVLVECKALLPRLQLVFADVITLLAHSTKFQPVSSLSCHSFLLAIMSTLPSYIQVPSAARPIQPPDRTRSSLEDRERKVDPPLPAKPSFPPTASTSTQPAAAAGRKYAIPTASLPSNVSDLLLSSLLPTNLPKLPTAKVQGGPGRPRELNTQREGLRLDIMSHNFRRFITKVS